MVIMGEFYNFGGFGNSPTWRDESGYPINDATFSEPMDGGKILIGAGGLLEINSPNVLFGPASILEIEPSSFLKVNGDLYVNGVHGGSNGSPLAFGSLQANYLLLNEGEYHSGRRSGLDHGTPCGGHIYGR